MDPAQNPPQTQSTNNDTQTAMQRGDIPIQPTTSQQVTAARESETLSKMNVVTNAQSLNLQNTAKETSQTGSNITSANGTSKDHIRELSEKVQKAKLPKPFEDILNDRIERLAIIGQSSGLMSSTFVIEFEQASRYIDWAVKMPWESESQDLLDLAKAKEIMDQNHYGLEPLKQRVLEYIASLMLNIKNNKNTDNIVKAPILCVLGLAGTGKTTFAKSIADALGRSFERIAFGGMADSRVLRGQSRFFPDAEPGAIIKKMVHGKTKNPVICLDELDRVTDTARADIMGVLIEVLDPEQNTNFIDHYIDYPFSLRKIIFIATANNLSSVATAVLDRLEIINMPSYNDEEKIMIGKKFLLPKSMKATGLLPNQLQIDEPVWEPLVRPLGYDPGVRGLDRLITNVCRKAAVLIISGQTQTVRVTVDNVKQFMPEW